MPLIDLLNSKVMLEKGDEKYVQLELNFED